MTAQPFLWGAATSSHQIDGDHRFNDWWAWEATGAIEGGVRSGQATGHRTKFRDDLKLAAEMGLTSYRFSFEWSWLEPEEGRWDETALQWYQDLIDTCAEFGLVPMATLHHFTLPNWLAERGGFSHKSAPVLFAKYVERVATAFGSRIPLWCTVNEPIVLAVGSYLGRFMPPAVYDPAAASRACANLLRAHVFAYDILKGYSSRREGPWRARPLEVGFAHNMLHFLPERPLHPLEAGVTKFLSYFYNDAWLNAVNGGRQMFGLPGVMPFAPQVNEARGRRTFDFIGVNYYTKCYVRWRPRTLMEGRTAEIPVGLSFAKRKETTSDLGWAVHPRGLGHVLNSVMRFRAPVYITENGIADGQDRLRSKYLLEHLEEVARARERGCDIRGYYHWSLLDNFEWIKGFGPRFGLASVDYETLERLLRPSANLYREIIKAHEGIHAPELERLAINGGSPSPKPTEARG
jgi:beta-glucosidase